MDKKILKVVFLDLVNRMNQYIALKHVLNNNLQGILRKRRRQSILLWQLFRKRQILINKQLNNRIWAKYRCRFFWEDEVSKYSDSFFKEKFRVSRNTFNVLCGKLGKLEKKNTNYRKCISLEKRVAIALFSLGSSSEYRVIAKLFGVGKSTVCEIVLDFCKEVWEALKPECFDFFPLQEDKVKECVAGFEALGFPQCFGALDGCHIEVKPHKEYAVDYQNSKGWYSTILLALVDYRYRFLYINVGSVGKCSDSQIFEQSVLKRELQRPLLQELSRTINGAQIPALIIGDSAFPLSKILMNPYPFDETADIRKKTYNYALSKCHRVVENAFGQLKCRFRRLGKGIDNAVKNANCLIKVCCALHNFLNMHNDTINQQWLQQQQRNSNREQPDTSTINSDYDPTAEIIRTAISDQLLHGAEESVVELRGVEVNEPEEPHEFSCSE